MPDLTNFSQKHAEETYKALPIIAVEVLKAVTLLNGGAAIALLAFIGNIANHPGPIAPADMRWPLTSFAAGLVCDAVAWTLAYITQLTLHNENVNPNQPRTRFKNHTAWLYFAVILVLLSIVAFATGAGIAAAKL